MKIHRSQVPWHMVRNRCTRCGGLHAPWWATVRAPSCHEGSDRENSLTMFLEYAKAAGL